MKKTITTLALALSILGVSAQSSNCNSMGQNASKPSPDAQLLNTMVEGDYLVSRWLVKRCPGSEEEFSMQYQINIEKLISSYDNNSQETTGLQNFIDGLTGDQTKSILKINIYGSASPDGLKASNQRLAKARAADFREYINSNYGFTKYDGITEGIAQPWSATVEAIEESSIPNKAAVLKIVNSTSSDSVIEQRLKAMPSSWSYLAQYILPPMRCVAVEVVYNDWCIVETRTRVAQHRATENNYFIVVEGDQSDILVVENPDAAPIDFDKTKSPRSKFIFKENPRREKYKGNFLGFKGRNRRLVKYR